MMKKMTRISGWMSSLKECFRMTMKKALKKESETTISSTGEPSYQLTECSSKDFQKLID